MFNPSKQTHTHTYIHTMTTKHTFSSALSVIVRELHIRSLSENHVDYIFPPQRPWHRFTLADNNMQIF